MILCVAIVGNCASLEAKLRIVALIEALIMVHDIEWISLLFFGIQQATTTTRGGSRYIVHGGSEDVGVAIANIFHLVVSIIA
jgi:hypothetical protein